MQAFREWLKTVKAGRAKFMSNASGAFWVGMVIDGDKVDGNLRATTPLMQLFQKDTNDCIPDWTVAANQPIIYPVMRSQNEGTVKGIVTNSEKWYYNGVEIVFNSSNVATVPAVIAGKVQRVSYNNGTLNVPSLKIIGNLASNDNVDSDIIRMTGDIEASGHNITFDIFIGLDIAEFTESGYTGFLSVTNGGIIDEEGETIKVTPSLYKGGSKMTSGYSVKWLKPPYSTIFSTAGTVTLGRDDIDSRLNLMCQFVVDGAVVDTRIITLSDEIDPYFVSCEYQGTTMLEATGANSSVIFTYKVKKMGTGAVVSGYTFTTTLTGARGQVVTPTVPPTASGCTIRYEDVKNAGGNLTGNVTATKS